MSAADEDALLKSARVYSTAEAAERTGLREYRLEYLARKHLVPHTRSGSDGHGRVGWTAAQLVDAVAYLATDQAPPPKPTRKTERPPAPRRGEIAPLESKPGSRYARA